MQKKCFWWAVVSWLIVNTLLKDFYVQQKMISKKSFSVAVCLCKKKFGLMLAPFFCTIYITQLENVQRSHDMYSASFKVMKI